MNWPEDFLETPAFDLVARAMARAAQSRMIGTTVSHYRIEECLGGGGMGLVYRAVDTRLHRDHRHLEDIRRRALDGGVACHALRRKRRESARVGSPWRG